MKHNPSVKPTWQELMEDESKGTWITAAQAVSLIQNKLSEHDILYYGVYIRIPQFIVRREGFQYEIEQNHFLAWFEEFERNRKPRKKKEN